jgi:phosphotransferase system  glucose/maltose/N-acetylglucosamine-specific IIC component
MRFDLKQTVRVAVACGLATVFAVPQSLMAQVTAHVVNPSEMQKEMLASAQARQQNLETVRNFLSSAQALKAMKSAHVNPEQVKTSVSSLSDAELASLASRAEKAQADFAAGTFDTRDLVLIILALVALILIIVAVR